MSDTTLLLMLLGNGILWAVAGFQVCTSRHRQRGMEVDHLFDSPADLLPGGAPFIVPGPRDRTNA